MAVKPAISLVTTFVPFLVLRMSLLRSLGSASVVGLDLQQLLVISVVAVPSSGSVSAPHLLLLLAVLPCPHPYPMYAMVQRNPGATLA